MLEKRSPGACAISRPLRPVKRWFVSARDEHGIPRVYAHGDTEEEVLKKAQLAATEYRASKQDFR